MHVREIQKKWTIFTKAIQYRPAIIHVLKICNEKKLEKISLLRSYKCEKHVKLNVVKGEI